MSMATSAHPREIQTRVQEIRRRIAAACEQAGRDPLEVTLIAVTKTVAWDDISAAHFAGVRCFGENRVQEAAQKISPAPMPGVQWHLIGHLQTNKVKKALELFHVIQSVDSLHLAEALQRQAAALQRSVEIFIEVNTSGEASKFGIPPHKTLELAQAVAALPNLHLTGLMTIGALTDQQEQIRGCFRRLRDLFHEINTAQITGGELQHLSMGMTDDFELAIAEGATMVRIGRAIFGARS